MPVSGNHRPNAPIDKLTTAYAINEPVALGGDLFVVVPSASGNRSHVVAWVPKTPLPVAGDACLVAYDENSNPWVVAWVETTGSEQELWEPGDLKASARSSAPEGWLLCQGQAVSRTTYAALFSAIGTTFGEGNKTTTFNVPDGRNSSMIGASGTHALGSKGGAETVTLTSGQMPAHAHETASTYTGYFNATIIEGAIGILRKFIEPKEKTGSAGSGEAHPNMPPFFVGNWQIKT